MPNVQRVDDVNDVGGAAQVGVSSVRVNNKPIIVVGNPVAPHQKHKGIVTTGGSGTVKAGGKPVIRTGDADSCGHSRVGGSGDVKAG